MTAPVRVKICGITSLADALAAVDAGADALGFNFYPKSKRYVPLKAAAAIIRKLPPFIARVGVFVDPTESDVVAALSSCRLDWLQMHGDEDLGFMSRFPLSMQIKALRIRDKRDLKRIREYPGCAAFLLDAFVKGAFGGTGKTLRPELAREAARTARRPVILAGGLTPENVAEAVRRARPWAVDSASGVESAPGRKDADKMRHFIFAAKGAL